jgi:hypothetical protein
MEISIIEFRKFLSKFLYRFRFLEHYRMSKYRYHKDCGGEYVIQRTFDWKEYYFVCENKDSVWKIGSEKERKRILNYFKYIGAREVIIKSSIEDAEELIQRLNELGIDQDKQAEEFEQYVRKSRGLE